MIAASKALRVGLLGKPRVTWNGAPFTFRTPRKTLQTLAYVALHRGSRIARSTLAFALWPDDEEETALANLRRNLYLLTRNLPESSQPWLAIDAAALAWNDASDATFDVWEFERAAAERPEEAVDLYAGELLEGRFDEWLEPERDRLRSVYVRALREAAAVHRSRRRFAAAIDCAQRILAQDPWREDALRLSMALRFESGDRAGALAECDDFARRLQSEMGVEPMPETSAIRASIERNELASDIAVAQPREAADTGSRFALPFLGRHRELGTLRAAWTDAAGGAGAFALVGGEAGIGKTRLCAELATVVESEGGRVVRGATTSPERAPYQSLVEALRGALPLLTASALEPTLLGILGRVLPELAARRRDVAVSPAAALERQPELLFDALVAAFEALARPRPLTVVLEDLHLAGDATIAALQHIVRRTRGARMLLVATYRHDEAERNHPLRRMRRALLDENFMIELTPAPLGPDDVAALPSLLPDVDDDAARALLSQSEGNPLFLTELVRSRLEGEDAPAAGGGFGAIVDARLERLTPEARRFCEIAAVVGATFDVEVARECAGWTEDRASAALDELLDRSLVREATGERRIAYAFSHGLVRATLYDAIDTETRARRHRRIARVLEDIYGDRTDAVAEIAEHYERGAVFDAAARAYLTVARRAASVAAHEDAIAAATRGLALSAPNDPSRAALYVVRGHAAFVLGRYEAAATDARAARDGAERAPFAGAPIVEALCLLADAAANSGRMAEAESVLQEAIARATSSGERGELARALLQTGRTAILRQDYAAARAPLEEALAIFRERSEREGEAHAAHLLGNVLSRSGEIDASVALLETAKRLSTELGDSPGTMAVLINLVIVAMRDGAVDEAVARIRQASAIAENLRDARSLAICSANLAFLLLRRGEAEAARAEGERAIEGARAISHRSIEALALGNHGAALRELGRFDEALAAFAAATTLRSEMARPGDQTADLVELALTHLERGDLDEAAAIAERLEAVPAASLAALSWPYYCDWVLARIYAAAGDSDRAADRAARGGAGLREQLARIGNDEARSAFLAIPLVQRIAAMLIPHGG